MLSVGLVKLNGIEAAKRISEAVPGVKLLFATQIIDPDVMTEVTSDPLRSLRKPMRWLLVPTIIRATQNRWFTREV